MKGETRHIGYLDSLRGIAALTVVLHHVLFSVQPPRCVSIFYHCMVAGKTSVCLFFILSGFVLSYKFIGDRGAKWKIIESIIKRPIRLAGVILFATYLTLIQYWNIIGHPQGTQFLYMPFIHPFTFGNGYNGVLWTIDIELMGSFLVFGLLMIINVFHKNTRLIILAVLAIFFYNSFYLFFIIGIFCADIIKHYKFDAFIKYKECISWIILFPAIYLYSYSGTTINAWGKCKWNERMICDWGYINYASGAILIFIVVLMNKKIQNFLMYNRFQFLGRVSYSMYATHTTICAIVSSFLIGRFLCNYFEITMLFRCLLYLLIVFLASYLIDRFIDKPTIKFSGWFAKKLVTEIQHRLVIVRNMATPILRKVKVLIRKVLYKHRYAPDPLVLIPVESEDKDKNEDKS